MKKIFLYITVIYATISMASNAVDVKFATNFGVGLEGGTYYNLYGSKNHSKKSSDSDQAIFKNSVVFIGSLEAKVLKSFNIKKDLKVKVGAGASIDITKLPILDKIVKVITKRDDYLDLPHTGSYSVGKNKPFQDEVAKIRNDQWGYGKDRDDAEIQMPKLIDLSRKRFYTSLTAFGTIEMEKILKNFSVYFGVDAGLDIVLETIEEIVTYKKDDLKYTLERRKSRVRPKVKGYTGINYKGFETEIGLGYPQFVTIGLGYRFNL